MIPIGFGHFKGNWGVWSFGVLEFWRLGIIIFGIVTGRVFFFAHSLCVNRMIGVLVV